MKKFLILALAAATIFAVTPAVAQEPKPVATSKLEAVVGTPPAAGWKWQLAERAFRSGKSETHSHGPIVMYTMEGLNELRAGNTVQRFPVGQVAFLAGGIEHWHGPYPANTSMRFIVFQLVPGDAKPAADTPTRKILLFSEKPIEARPGVRYSVRVREVLMAPGARSDLHSHDRPGIRYVLEGTRTTRVGNQVSTFGTGKGFEIPLNVRFVGSNEGTAPLRYLALDLVPETPSK